MHYWLQASPLLIHFLMPFVFAYFWRKQLRAKAVFVLVSFLAAFGISVLTTMLAGFLMEPLMRWFWDVPRSELVFKNHPSAPYITAAFLLTLNVLLMLGLMIGLRRALTVKLTNTV